MSHNGSSESSSYADENWATWFVQLSGNQYFCEVERSYIEDSFNLFGIKQYLPKLYSKALDTILDRLEPDEPETDELSTSAVLLYGLIHARYIITSHGLEAMRRKYLDRDFGECPRMLCRGQPVVPMGFTDDPKKGVLKLFCPMCRDVFNCHSNQRHIDGAFFGPTFPNLFFMTYENLVPPPAMEQFVPRVFGFRIHPTSYGISNRATFGPVGPIGTRGIQVLCADGRTQPMSLSMLIGNSTGNGMLSNVAAESSSSTLAIQSRLGSAPPGVSHVIRGEAEMVSGNKNNSGESNHNSISEETQATADVKGLAKNKNKQSTEMKGERDRRSEAGSAHEDDNGDATEVLGTRKSPSRQSKRISEEAVKDESSSLVGRVSKRGRR